MKPWQLAWRLWRRERRSGALRTLFWALAVATAALSAVLLFSARLEQALLSQAGELLAADLVISSRQPLPATIDEQLSGLQLQQAETIEFPTVVFAGDQSLLVAVKAVTGGYPLRGQLRADEQLEGSGVAVQGLPASGEAWAEPRLLNELGVNPGERIEIGDSELTIRQVLHYEPDRGGNFYSLSPRLLINLEDARQAQLLGTGARLNYRRLLAGSADQIAQAEARLSALAQDDFRLLSLNQAEDRGNAALDQARRFLAMAAMTAVILAAIAIWLSAARYASAQRATVALLRCLGETWRPVFLIYLFKVLYTALAALPLGLLFGYLGHAGLIHSLSGIDASRLPAAGFSWLFFVVLYLLILSLAFALPQIWVLRQVPPRQVLHGEEERQGAPGVWSYLPALAGLLLLTLGQLRSPWLSLYLLGGATILLVILMLIARGAIAVARRYLPQLGPSWRYALGSVARRARGNALQTAAIGLGLAALLLLSVVRSELFNNWQASLPRGTPNRFLLNIQPQQASALQEMIRQAGVQNVHLEPMAVGKITTINGVSPNPENYSDPLAADRLSGTTNLSWRADLPAANRIISGGWWDSSSDEAQVSLAQRLAEPLDLKVGDRLGLRIGEAEIEARISSIREVDWDSFQVNFFILLNPVAAEGVPHNLITSFHLKPAQSGLPRTLTRAFPNISVIDTEAILQRLRDIIGQVSRAAQVVFVFTLAAGLLVLVTAIQAARGERRREAAILRTLGARRSFVLKGWLLEYALMGSIAGVMAVIFSWIVGWLISQQLFELSYTPRPWLFLIGLGLGIAVVTLTGWLGNRRVLNDSPLSVLRAN